MSGAKDPYRYFRVEAREIAGELSKAVLELERAPSPELVARILRQAHTLKGAARVVKQRAIADHSHAIEEAVGPLRAEGSVASARTIQELLARVDGIERDVLALDTPPAAAAQPQAKPVAEEPHAAVVAVDLPEVDDLLDGLAEAAMHLEMLRRTPEGRALAAGLDRVEREISQAREVADRLRLVPAGAMFASLERTARDAARDLGKRATFEGRGAEVRLDAKVVGAAQKALVQLVRNAVAHGIEREGKIVVAVKRRGARVVFSCHDDGRGFDLVAVRALAAARGVEGAEELTDAQAIALLFEGGMTTASRVSEVAGRGIGLDVVREAARAMKGEARVESAPGAGSLVEIELPASLASVDALLVEAGGVEAAIPLDAVRRTARLADEDIARAASGEGIVHDGEVIPFVHLSRTLAQTRRAAGVARATVVIAGSKSRAAIGVDRIIGIANVVVRALPHAVASIASVALTAGAALDVEGNPRLVLDPDHLVAFAAGAGKEALPVEARAALPVLVIDDSLTTRMLEQSILESAGYDVDLASSAEEAWDMARARRYALFLCDVEMPGMSGFDFVEKTRADPELGTVPAILVTSRGSPEDLQRGRDAGASGHLVKSEFDQQKLLEKIRKLIA